MTEPDSQKARSSARVARNLMATRFEIFMHGADPKALQAAGEEALDEIERLEGLLSFYNPTSVVSDINRRASKRAVTVDHQVFDLLALAKEVWERANGAFDISVAPLVEIWGFTKSSGHMPSIQDLADALFASGMDGVELDAARRSVRLTREGAKLDLGSIGKGYALDQAAMILRELEIPNALLHGGTSSAYAFGHAPDGSPWKIAINAQAAEPTLSEELLDPDTILGEITLSNESLSVSAPSGKSFEYEGQEFGHVIDPRVGEPGEKATLAAAVHSSAARADAYATALLIEGRDGIETLLRNEPGLRGLVADTRGVLQFGNTR